MIILIIIIKGIPMEKFNDELGRYVNTAEINVNTLSAEEREGVALESALNEQLRAQNSGNTLLDMSNVLLDTAIQNKAAYEVEKQLIIDDKNLNPVERNVAFAALDDKSRGLDLALELSQKSVADDVAAIQKINGKVVAAQMA